MECKSSWEMKSPCVADRTWWAGISAKKCACVYVDTVYMYACVSDTVCVYLYAHMYVWMWADGALLFLRVSTLVYTGGYVN